MHIMKNILYICAIVIYNLMVTINSFTMKKIMINILFSFILLGSFSCKKFPVERYQLRIKNNSNVDICCYFYLVWEGGNKGVVYPDTLLSFDKKELVCINTTEEYTTSRSGVPITEWISSLPQDTLSIFIFSNDTLNKYSWVEIQSGYKILQRYDLSQEDFKQLSGKNDIPVIPYPPTDAMRYMKMYPPYDD